MICGGTWFINFCSEQKHSISTKTNINNDVVPFQQEVPFSPHASMILFVSCDKQEMLCPL